MRDANENVATGERKSGNAFLMYLLAGFVFPALFIAFLNLCRLPLGLLRASAAPDPVVRLAGFVAAALSLGSAYWLTRKAWRRRPG